MLKKKVRAHRQTILLGFLVAVLISSFAYFVYLVKVQYDQSAQFEESLKKTHEKLSSVLFILEDQINSMYLQASLDTNLFYWMQQKESGIHNMYMLSEIQQNFIKVINSNPLIVSIYLYNKSNDTVLSTNHEFTRLDQFPDRELFERRAEPGSQWVEARVEKAGYGNPKTIITFVGNIRDLGWVAINVDEQRLFTDFPQMHNLLLVGKRNHILTSRIDPSETIKQEHIDRLSKLSAAGNQPGTIDNDYVYTSGRSPGEWKIVSFAPRIESSAEWGQRRNLIMFMFVVMAGTAVLLYIFMRKHYFRPMIQYRTRFDKNLEDLRHHFILNILTGKLKEQDIWGKAQEMNLQFPTDRYMVIVYQIDDYYEYLLSMKQDERFFMDKTIYSAIKWTFMTKYFAYTVKAELEKIAILISIPDDGKEEQFAAQVMGTIKYLQQEIKSTCNLTVCAGISNFPHPLGQVHTGYFEAITAVGYKAIYGRHTVIPYKDIPAKHQGQTIFPVIDMHELNGFIKEGELQRFEQSLNVIMSEVLSGGHFSFEFMNAVLSNILFGLVKLALELRYDIANIIKEDIFMKLYSTEFAEDKKQYVLYAAKAVSDYIHARKTGNNKTFQLIRDYIDQNYDKPISLTTISDSLGVNASYISSLIKNELGYGFVDYLNHLRIKKATHLLEDKGLAINKISEACGYDTVHSFIRNFKKIHFFTPSEYRSKIHENHHV
jgi:AraC-like DNA-binding protein